MPTVTRARHVGYIVMAAKSHTAIVLVLVSACQMTRSRVVPREFTFVSTTTKWLWNGSFLLCTMADRAIEKKKQSEPPTELFRNGGKVE